MSVASHALCVIRAPAGLTGRLQVIDSWDAADDSEEEAKKAKAAAERKAKADAEAAANKKSKAARRAEREAEKQRLRQAEEDESSSEEEDEASRRERLRQTEQDADLAHAEDLFGGIGISSKRSAAKAVVTQDPNNPDSIIDLSALPLFNPSTKADFAKLRDTLGPVLAASAKRAQYTLFLQEFSKILAKELPSDQIKKIASGLTTLSNEKMKEEKLAERGGKKTKAAKTKTSLVANRDASARADMNAYEDGLDDGWATHRADCF